MLWESWMYKIHNISFCGGSQASLAWILNESFSLRFVQSTAWYDKDCFALSHLEGKILVLFHFFLQLYFQ